MVQTVDGSGDGAADGGNLTISSAVTINNGTLDINSGGGNISITGNIGSAGVDEAIILDDGTTVNVGGSGTASTGTITLGGTVTSGDITLIGDSGISIAGDITSNKTASAGAISFTGPVTLAGNVVITSDDNATSSITFDSTATINSDSTARTLKLDTDGGAIVLNGAVGAATNGALSSLTINGPDDGEGAGDIDVANIGGSGVGVTGATVIGNTNTDDLVLDGTVYKTTGAQTYTAATGDKILVGTTNNAVSFNTSNANVAFNTSDVKLASGANLTVDTNSGNNGTITFQGSIHGTGNTANTVTDITSLDGGGAAVTVNAIDSNIEDISITGPTTLKGNITTASNGTVTITGNTTINGAVTIDTKTGGGANVLITGTLDATATTDDLDINAGTGTIEITGNIGGGGTAFETIDLNAVASTANPSTSTGGVTLGGDIGVTATARSGVTNIGNAETTGAITLSGTMYHTSGALTI